MFNDDKRIIRRIVAEDPNYNLSTINSLNELCLKEFVKNFEFNPSNLIYLQDSQRKYLIERLDPNTPLKVTANLIIDESYWRKCCQHAKWFPVDLFKHGGSWKRAYFELLLEHNICTFVPGHSYMPQLEEYVSLAVPYVYNLNIKQLLPPIKQMTQSKTPNEESDTESDWDQTNVPIQMEHLDLGPIVDKLSNLEELAVSYGVQDCGMNFDWTLFQFTEKDCLNFSKAVQGQHTIKVLHLTKSRVTSDQCNLLVNHFLDHPNLESLDLSHNLIGDRGIRALAKLISSQTNGIKCLNLSNNRLESKSGLILAHALMRDECVLQQLNLKLNAIQTEGAVALAKALMKNETLQEFNVSANNLNEMAANYFAQVLVHNKTLTHLDFSNNELGIAGSKSLQDGIEMNHTLVYLDLRFTGSSQEAEYAICQHLKNNLKNNLENEKKADLTQCTVNAITCVASGDKFSKKVQFMSYLI